MKPNGDLSLTGPFGQYHTLFRRSSRERIGTVGGKLLPVATGVGRGRCWSSSSRRSRLATNVSLAISEGPGMLPKISLNK
jgi:hypothetical protein